MLDIQGSACSTGFASAACGIGGSKSRDDSCKCDRCRPLWRLYSRNDDIYAISRICRRRTAKLHNRTSELMKAVADGAELEVTNHGKVVGRMKSVRPILRTNDSNVKA